MSRTTASRTGLAGLRVLVVDDEDDIRLGLCRLIGSLGASVTPAADGLEALAAVQAQGADVILTDLMMPRMSGSDLLLAVQEHAPETRVVLLTGYGTIQTAVTCLQNGAAHFMTKPFDNEEVLRLVERMGRQILAGRKPEPERREGGEFIAEDPAMARVLELIARVAPSPVPVLIEGESGTGKEMVARAVHERSAAADKPYLAVNAAALPDTLLESELFGYQKGAFTGADRTYAGIFAQADGGTVFLDEIASMSPSFQGKLLRVLQEKVVRPLGGGRDVPVSFRLVAATNRDLSAMIARGEFREDLFYRLGVVRIPLPPLRKRKQDVTPLALAFLAKATETCIGPGAPVPELTEGAIAALHAHSWPGNVRELENVMHRAVIVATGGRIHAYHLGLSPEAGWGEGEDGEGCDYDSAKQSAIEAFQREFVQRALEATEGNVSHAAERCGLTRAAFQRIMRQLGIERGAFLPIQ